MAKPNYNFAKRQRDLQEKSAQFISPIRTTAEVNLRNSEKPTLTRGLYPFDGGGGGICEDIVGNEGNEVKDLGKGKGLHIARGIWEAWGAWCSEEIDWGPRRERGETLRREGVSADLRRKRAEEGVWPWVMVRTWGLVCQWVGTMGMLETVEGFKETVAH